MFVERLAEGLLHDPVAALSASRPRGAWSSTWLSRCADVEGPWWWWIEVHEVAADGADRRLVHRGWRPLAGTVVPPSTERPGVQSACLLATVLGGVVRCGSFCATCST
jgi:hypothetical protein